MDSVEILTKYFPELTAGQRSKFEQLGELYRRYNARINLVSRKDIDHLFTNHILHSLAIGKIFKPKNETRFLDIGTGGGLPGIPLAILFPGVNFHLIDSTRKKIGVVQELVAQLKLERVSAQWIRAEEIRGDYDFVIGRAVTSLPRFLDWSGHRVSVNSQNEVPNGIIYLKGGEIENEMIQLGFSYHLYRLSDYFEESYYSEKKLVHIHV